MKAWIKGHSKMLVVGGSLVFAFGLAMLVLPALTSRSGAQEHQEEHGPLEHADEEREEGVVELSQEARQTAGIRIATAAPGAVARFIEAPGIVRANQDHVGTVIPTISGVLTAVSVNVGDRVRRGQVLAVLRSAELAQEQAELEQAKRELALAQQTHSRTEKLAAAGAFSQPPTEQAAQGASEADQAVEEAQAEVEDRADKVRVAERNLKRVREAIGLGSIGQESIEDAQRNYDETVEAQSAAQAEFTRAQAELQRQQGLIGQGLTTQQALDQARKDMVTAQAALANAESQVQITAAKLTRAKELVAQDIVTGGQVDAAMQALVEAEQALVAARARLREAQRRHDIARQRLEREQNIYDQDLLAAQELARTELEVRRAESALKAATNTVGILSQGRAEEGGIMPIVAPVFGTIIRRSAKVGEVVDNTSILFEIANTRTVFVEASLYEQDVAEVKRGQSMRIRVQAYPEAQFEGVVDSIDPVLDSEAKKVVVRALIDNPKGQLMPGMFAEVRISVGAVEAPLAVPITALETDGGQEYVFIEIAPNRFQKRDIGVGRRGRDYVEIREGVQPGEKVVASGSFFLKSELVKETFGAEHAH